jgi:hypothetical protein
MILLSTPFGQRGFFFTEWVEGQDWKRFSVTARECPRISPDFLEEERATLGDWWFRQEYLCAFGENVDQYFTSEEITAAISGDVVPLFGSEGDRP